MDIFAHTRALIRIRKQNPAIACGYLFTLFADRFIYAYMREYRQNTIIVVINNGLEDMPQPIEINIGANSNIPARIKRRLTGAALANQLDPSDTLTVLDGKLNPWLKGKEARIYALN